MPKLNPDRILGPRGVTILSEVFQDFTPKGGDHVFEDLDRAMKKMEHWAHRMYPKLPFDNTMARVSVLGKKMQIQVSAYIYNIVLKSGRKILWYLLCNFTKFCYKNFVKLPYSQLF